MKRRIARSGVCIGKQNGSSRQPRRLAPKAFFDRSDMKDWLISELKAMSQPQDGARYALSLSQERIMLLERLPAGDTVLGEAKFGDATWDE
ncbi:MAG: hypothetical protein AAFV26_11975, partial [Pseudomonadota bacterium]